MYHYINSNPPADELAASLTVTEPNLMRQLHYLRCAGYYSITLSQLFDAMQTGAPLPEKAVILTFDDGYADAYSNAFPILRSAGFGGSFGIVSDWVGQPGYLTWEQLKEMSATGMEVVSHTANHPDLGRSPDWMVRDQLVRSKQVLEQNLGLPVSFLIYPSGEPFTFGTPVRQAQVPVLVQESGYRGALTTRWGLVQDPAAAFAMSRVRVPGGVDINRFAENMGGPPPDQIGC
jgi:peptidoglycan/xylan/chitin deacetylase (PgdA/CDA1 family)